MDKSGRPRPNRAALDEVRIPADIIVVAIGQGIEIQGFDQAGVPITRGGRLVAALSGQVSDMDNVFAGGDCVTGPATAIRAIAAGKVAAANIDEHLAITMRSGWTWISRLPGSITARPTGASTPPSVKPVSASATLRTSSAV